MFCFWVKAALKGTIASGARSGIRGSQPRAFIGPVHLRMH
jgi:hypothetical protein